MLQRRWPRVVLVIGFIGCAGSGCGGGGKSGLDQFLPDVPSPTGDAQSVYAGLVTAGNADSELIPGEAASGMVGDLYIRNSRGRYIIQSPTRVIGVIPQGGNLVDAQPIGPDGKPIGDDEFGELAGMYVLGRTCEHDQIDVVQDGSGGGAAAIVARGHTGNDDFLNLKGIGLINVPADLDPDIPDSVDCATTYILEPDSPTLQVYWTFYNAGQLHVKGPFAALSDTGGSVYQWGHGRGFEQLGISTLASGTGPSPVDYAVFQGPGVAYGIVPQHDDGSVTNSAFQVQGVSIVLYGAQEFLDIVRPEGVYLDLPPKAGVTEALHVISGRDASDVEAQVRADRGDPANTVSGRVTWGSGDPAAGARVGLYEDTDGNGAIGPDDRIMSYADTDADGRYSATVAQGKYLVKAVENEQGESTVTPVDLSTDQSGVDFSIPQPVYYDYTVVDDATSQPVPARIIVVGQSPLKPDMRLFSTHDRWNGVATETWAIHGTSVDMGDGADPRLALIPGASYRILAARGTEWSVASTTVSPVAGDPTGDLELRIRHVVETPGYLSSEYHVHSIGSPDSPIDWPTRVATAAADGVELFASTEHDFIADLEPIIQDMGLQRWVRAMPGEEVTPFAIGHFNAFPLTPDLNSPNHGAIDWARGADGFALVPKEIFAQARDKGAEVVEVNHPRSPPGALTNFMQFFDRADLQFDYKNRSISGDLLTQPVPNEWLRLPPDTSMWNMDFNQLEVWNGFTIADSDGDGRREVQSLDVVLRDWFNFLSFGFEVTPVGNSDTHTAVRNPMGMPRTMVWVGDDSANAIASGLVVNEALDTLAARGGAPRDVVVTDGPMIYVTRKGQTDSAIGRVIDGSSGGTVTLTVKVEAATWAQFDTIEVFANAVPDINSQVTALKPVMCFTPVAAGNLDPNDPCKSAPLGTTQLNVQRVQVAPGFDRYEAQVDVTLDAATLPYPEGGTGKDAWVVVRARGNRSIYPILLNDTITSGNLSTLVNGTEAAVDTAEQGIGVPANAVTGAIYLDLDGGGYTAQFAPK